MNRSRWCIIALALELVLLLAAARFGDFSMPGAARTFVLLAGFAGACYLVAIEWFEGVSKLRRPAVFWIAAILLRLVLLPMEPGDDVWRYRWEGEIQQAGYSPYTTAPDSPELQGLRTEWWPKINHAGTPTIYPPGAELLFRAVARLGGSVLLFKLVFLLAELMVIHLLLKLNTGSRRYRTTAWFAWNPAVLYATAGGAHFDSVMLALLVAAVWAAHRGNPMNNKVPPWTWALLSALLMGLAISMKWIPLFLLPVLAVALGRRAPALLVSLAIPWLLALPYGGLSTVLKPMLEFSKTARFNSAIPWLVERVWANPEAASARYVVMLAVVIAVVTWLFRNDWRRGMLWATGAVVLLSPVLHPWYVVWVLPFACWRIAPAWSVFAISALATLLLWETTPYWNAWQPNLVTRGIVFLPPLVAVLVLWTYRKRDELADA